MSYIESGVKGKNWGGIGDSSGITGPGSGILSRAIGISSAVRWSGTVFRPKNDLIARTCPRLKTQLYYWCKNLFWYLSNTTFFLRVHRWLSAGSCLALDSFCFDSFFCSTISYIYWNTELVWVFWLQNKDLRKNSYNGHYLLPMISLCTLNNDFIHALESSTMKDEVFQWTKPCCHSSCYNCTWYCKLLLYFSADHAKKTIYGLLQAFSSSRFQASDQRKLLLNIKWQVSGEDGK